LFFFFSSSPCASGPRSVAVCGPDPRKRSTITSAAAAFPPGDHPCLPRMATKADRRRRRSNRRAVRRRAGGRIWWSIAENRRVEMTRGTSRRQRMERERRGAAKMGCVYLFSSFASSTQRKIKLQHDEIVKPNKAKTLTRAQDGDLHVPADRSSNSGPYTGYESKMQLPSMEQKAEPDEAAELPDISFEELLADEKKDLFRLGRAKKSQAKIIGKMRGHTSVVYNCCCP
ncbi:hypothetical protein MUK42_25648, partial [Musa troglodytarum]